MVIRQSWPWERSANSLPKLFPPSSVRVIPVSCSVVVDIIVVVVPLLLELVNRPRLPPQLLLIIIGKRYILKVIVVRLKDLLFLTKPGSIACNGQLKVYLLHNRINPPRLFPPLVL